MNDADETRALLAATQALMAPLARLLVARGVPYADAEEGLKSAMVEAARAAHPDGLPHRLVSRIATTTGINRREVTRLTRAGSDPVPGQRSAAAETFTRWRTAAAYADSQGRPAVLPRQGPAPSFESLARSVTQDVHPRSLLDELLRLGLARHDPGSDSVALTLDAFVPSADRARMLEFLAHNVGDHLSAAVANVLAPTPSHLERAVFAHGLSAQSVASAQAWMEQAWRDMLAGLVPFLERLMAEEADVPGRDLSHRFRAGLYAWAEREGGEELNPDPPEAESTGRQAAAAKAARPRTRRAARPPRTR